METQSTLLNLSGADPRDEPGFFAQSPNGQQREGENASHEHEPGRRYQRKASSSIATAS
jgi:hypothetical protein